MIIYPFYIFFSNTRGVRSEKSANEESFPMARGLVKN